MVLFYTTAAAMRAEKVVSRAGFAVKLIPTPRELSTDCGAALRFPLTLQSRVAILLAEAAVDYAGIHFT